MSDKYSIVTAAERTDLYEHASKIVVEVWPEFMLHDEVCIKYMGYLRQNHPELQFGLWDNESDTLAAFANSLAFQWDGRIEDLPNGGIDWALIKSYEDAEAGRTPNLQCAVQIVIPKSRQGSGLSTLAVRTMIEIGKKRGLKALVAPVRPNLKHQYPLIPCEEYITWKTSEGLPFDPWLRVHARIGGKIVKVCDKSMDIRGTVEDWENWTKLNFPGSGRHIIPGALVPVEFDLEKDEGVYIEPNVWTVHEW